MIDLRRFGALLALVAAAVLAVGLLALVGTKPAEAAFSGTNGKITFTSDRDLTFQSDIYVMDQNGFNQTRLTNNQTFDGNPVFSPSGTKIAFNSFRDLNDNIYVMDAKDEINNLTGDPGQDGNGDNLKRLTKKTASDTQPAFSPNGKIAFTTDRADPGGKLDIYVMKAKPEGKRNRPRNLTKNTPAFDDYDPSFCSNGDKIVFTTLRDEVNNDFNENIYVMKSDGTGVTQLTSNTAFDSDANFSPDCTKIVFRSGRVAGDNSEVYVMDAKDEEDNVTHDPVPDGEGDNMRNISNNSANDGPPAFSPDGNKIVFRSRRTTVDNPEGDDEVFVINVNGTGLTQLTVNDDADNFPDWGVAPT